MPAFYGFNAASNLLKFPSSASRTTKGIIIGDDVWIGVIAPLMVYESVRIASSQYLLAKDIPEYSIVGELC